MDEEYLFMNHDFQASEKRSDGRADAKNSSASLTPNYSSDEECSSKSDLAFGSGFAAQRSNDNFNMTMCPDDFMFFEPPDRSSNHETIGDQDSTFMTFSPARYFDLFGEVEGDDFQLSKGSICTDVQHPRKELKQGSSGTEDAHHQKALLNGVLNHRTLCPNFSRIKPVVSSCGNILRQSASVPNTRLAMSRMKVQKAVVMSDLKGQKPHNCRDKNTNSDLSLKGRAAGGTYSPLDDHRYYSRVKRSESPPPVKKRNFNIGSNMPASSKSCTTCVPERGTQINSKMSILELFLRATCPLDPNKGSEAALATKGMLNLCIREPGAPSKTRPVYDEDDDDDDLLKKLLTTTGDMDQTEAPELEDSSDRLSVSTQEDSPVMTYSVDSLLIDGFGLDVGLSVDEKGNFSIDDYSSAWQEGSLFELEESLRHQDHQDKLFMQQFTADCL